MSAYKNLFDTHLHTEWSGDSSTPVSDQINRAKELGLSGITITDHMDLDFPETPDRFKLIFLYIRISVLYIRVVFGFQRGEKWQQQSKRLQIAWVYL